jgi:hypothetical protein
MKLAQSVFVGAMLGAWTLLANAVSTIDFEEMTLAAGATATLSSPISSNGGHFSTLAAPGFASQAGNSFLVDMNAFETDASFLGVGSRLALQLAPNGGINPTNNLVTPYTELSFSSGTTITGSFSFLYASGEGILVQFFNGSAPVNFSVSGPATSFDSQCTSSSSKVCHWQLANYDLAALEATSVRFTVTNATQNGGSPDGITLIDNISLNYSPAAVPEPSTYSLMFLGLLGIGFLARRRMT